MKQIIEKEKCRAGTWFYPLIFDWMEANLNTSCKLEVNNKKGVGLSRLIDWRSSSYVSREKSSFSRSSYDILGVMKSQLFLNETYAWMNSSQKDQ